MKLTGPKGWMEALLICFLVALPFSYAAAGNNNGELVLDSSVNYKSTNFIQDFSQGLSYVPGALSGVQVLSSVANTFIAQFANKEAALNQNVELDVAKRNLNDSKDNVTTMFFFIVATFVVLFDAFISIIYIAMILVVVWIVFVGYAKFLILIINFISGKMKKKRGIE